MPAFSADPAQGNNPLNDRGIWQDSLTLMKIFKGNNMIDCIMIYSPIMLVNVYFQQAHVGGRGAVWAKLSARSYLEFKTVFLQLLEWIKDEVIVLSLNNYLCSGVLNLCQGYTLPLVLDISLIERFQFKGFISLQFHNLRAQRFSRCPGTIYIFKDSIKLS